MSKLVILGAGIHTRILLDICFDAGVEVHGLLDDQIAPGTKVLGVPVLGRFDTIEDRQFLNSYDFIVGIGGSQDGRRKWSSVLLSMGARLRTVVHPSSVVSRFAVVGEGTFIWQHATVMPDARIGKFTVIGCNSSIGDCCVIEDNVFVAGGCQINGLVTIKEDAYIGTGSVISAGCQIGRRSVVGLNSTVARNIPPEVVCVGPAAKVVSQGTGHIMAHIDNSQSGERILRQMNHSKDR